jgi:hypothetical protein
MQAAQLPEKAEVDALHIAITVTNRVDYLLTWNCRAPLETPSILGGRLDKIAIRFLIVGEAQQSQSEEPHE